ncbi:unnamed protein product [Closterium sp. Yama58-4]|nr:unnamed protein product [Closterium sp. Yama58-4]
MQHVDGLSRNPPKGGRNPEPEPEPAPPAAALTAMVRERGTGGEQQKGPADVWQDEKTLKWIKGEIAEDGGAGARAKARGQHYRWFQGQVQLQTKDGWKRVPAPTEREGIIREVHNKLGHYGPLRTLQLLQTGWWWAGMRKEVKEWVEKCELCCRNKASLLKSQAELQPLSIVELGYWWSLDIAGELPVSWRGRRYVLLMIEHVSKWAEARPLVAKMAEAVAEAFEEMVLTRFGACGEVLTDQGRTLADARAKYLKKLLPAAMESLKVAQLRDIHRYKQRQVNKMTGKQTAVEEGQAVYVRRAKRDGLDVVVSQQRWEVKEVRESGVLVLEDATGKRVWTHVTNVALAGKQQRAGGYSGPMTRARTAAAGHGRGQER